MKRKSFFLLFALTIFTNGLFAQLGLKAGVNMASEIKSLSQADIAAGFSTNNLTGYQIGLVYQAMPKKSGLGVEIAALLSQKGSTIDSTNLVNSITEGYKELSYIEVPFNLRYRLTLGFIGIYGIAGVYGGYALSGKIVDEIKEVTENETFQSFMDHVDYGYNFGAGIELFKKIQLGGTWSQGLKNTSNSTTTTTNNRVFSINLVYMF
jgi:hypothetical protein